VVGDEEYCCHFTSCSIYPNGVVGVGGAGGQQGSSRAVTKEVRCARLHRARR